MTDDRALPEELATLAAEYALGVLDAAESERARGLAASDPRFRQAVEQWLGRLGPMLDDVHPVAPPPTAWSGIEAATRPGREAGNVYVLRRRLTVWRGLTGAMTALAASLALFVMLRPPARLPVQPPVQAAPAAPMVARLSDEKQVALVASWDPQRGQLLLARAGGVRVERAHSHELWVIPAGGQPRSLGVMPEANQALMRLPAGASALMRAGATIAVSVEPLGGSPSGSPTGPVVASGALEAA
jgi:anti-sigma-K factor RskA